MIAAILILLALCTLSLDIFSLYLLLSSSQEDSGAYMKVALALFIVAIVGFAFFSISGWQHETKNITISDKFVLNSQMIVISSDGVAYTTTDKVIYSNLKSGNVYSVTLGHFRDSEPYSIGFINRDTIDKINFVVNLGV